MALVNGRCFYLLRIHCTAKSLRLRTETVRETREEEKEKEKEDDSCWVSYARHSGLEQAPKKAVQVAVFSGDIPQPSVPRLSTLHPQRGKEGRKEDDVDRERERERS